MTVKIRYKEPDGEKSALMTFAVRSTAAPSSELGFAAAVAEFGMLLRDSAFKGSSSYANAIAMAKRFKGEDQHGHRAEFIRLAGAADGVTRLSAAR
jgi:Ca-activated chloride channel family protein